MWRGRGRGGRKGERKGGREMVSVHVRVADNGDCLPNKEKSSMKKISKNSTSTIGPMLLNN